MRDFDWRSVHAFQGRIVFECVFQGSNGAGRVVGLVASEAQKNLREDVPGGILCERFDEFGGFDRPAFLK